MGQATDGDVDELASKLDDFAEVLKRGVLERYMRAKREQLRAGAEEASALQERHDALLRAKEAECESLREEGSALVLRAKVLDTAVGSARRSWARDRLRTRDLFSGERSGLRVFSAWRGFASARRRRRVAEARVARRAAMVRCLQLHHGCTREVTTDPAPAPLPACSCCRGGCSTNGGSWPGVAIGTRWTRSGRRRCGRECRQ